MLGHGEPGVEGIPFFPYVGKGSDLSPCEGITQKAHAPFILQHTNPSLPSLHVRSQSQTNPAFVQVLQHHDPTRRHQCTCLHQDHSSRIIHWTKIWRGNAAVVPFTCLEFHSLDLSSLATNMQPELCWKQNRHRGRHGCET